MPSRNKVKDKFLAKFKKLIEQISDEKEENIFIVSLQNLFLQYV